jgi:hypothetical protein
MFSFHTNLKMDKGIASCSFPQLATSQALGSLARQTITRDTLATRIHSSLSPNVQTITTKVVDACTWVPEVEVAIDLIWGQLSATCK